VVGPAVVETVEATAVATEGVRVRAERAVATAAARARVSTEVDTVEEMADPPVAVVRSVGAREAALVGDKRARRHCLQGRETNACAAERGV
jgi:hypothetical protein